MNVILQQSIYGCAFIISEKSKEEISIAFFLGRNSCGKFFTGLNPYAWAFKMNWALKYTWSVSAESADLEGLRIKLAPAYKEAHVRCSPSLLRERERDKISRDGVHFLLSGIPGNFSNLFSFQTVISRSQIARNLDLDSLSSDLRSSVIISMILGSWLDDAWDESFSIIAIKLEAGRSKLARSGFNSNLGFWGLISI